MSLNGTYFAKSITTTEADQDIIATMETILGVTKITAEKLTLISSTEFTVSVNNNAFADMYKDTDDLYKLSLDANDVVVDSLRIHESGTTVFLAMVY